MWRSSEARDVQAGRRGDAVEGDGSGTTWWAPTDELIIHQAENLNFCHRSNCNFADWTAPDGLRVRMLSPRRQQGGIKSCLSWIGEHCVCPLWGLLFQNVAPHHSLYQQCSTGGQPEELNCPKGVALVNFSPWFAFCFYTAGQPWWASCTDQTRVRWTSPNGRTNC